MAACYNIGMVTQSPDTDPEAEAAQFAAYRRMGPAGRARRIDELREAAFALAAAGIRARRPDIGERELRIRVVARWLGPDLAARVYPDIEFD